MDAIVPVLWVALHARHQPKDKIYAAAADFGLWICQKFTVVQENLSRQNTRSVFGYDSFPRTLFASRGNKATALFCQLNCWNQISRQARFEHVPRSAHFQSGTASIGILFDGKKNNSRGRLSF